MAKTKKETSESTELMVLSAEEQAYIDSLKAETQSTEYTGPNKLGINTKSRDENGVKRTIGAWHISGTDVYVDGIAYFRPVRSAKKLIRYSVDSAGNYSLAGQTVYFNDFMNDIPDSLGGNALGRKFGKNFTDEEKAATRKLAECYMDIFGFVRFEGSEESYPVLYRVRGTKMKQMDEAFRAVPKGKYSSMYEYALETYQPEGKTYWSIKVTPDMSQTLPLKPILAYDAEVQEYINTTNLDVISSYKKNASKNTEDKFIAANATTIEASSDDDELPF